MHLGKVREPLPHRRGVLFLRFAMAAAGSTDEHTAVVAAAPPVVITFGDARRRRTRNEIVRVQAANKCLKTWRAAHTRPGTPSYDLEFDTVSLNDFDWVGYLCGRGGQQELAECFEDADGLTHCEIRFLKQWGPQAKFASQLRRCDFALYRSDHVQLRLHPSQTQDAQPIRGYINDWAITPVETQELLDGPIGEEPKLARGLPPPPPPLCIQLQ